MSQRRTQAERTASTRKKLLDATVDSLIELGYAATTVTEVQERAGVARGTLLHHFPTRVELMVAAVAHLARRRAEQVEHDVATTRDDPLSAVVDLAWSALNAPAFFAALELWVAARTDVELRNALEPVEREIFSMMHQRLVAAFGTRHDDDPRVPTLVEFTIDLLTGLAMTGLLRESPGHRELLLRRWKRALGVLLGDLSPERLVERSR